MTDHSERPPLGAHQEALRRHKAERLFSAAMVLYEFVIAGDLSRAAELDEFLAATDSTRRAELVLADIAVVILDHAVHDGAANT